MKNVDLVSSKKFNIIKFNNKSHNHDVSSIGSLALNEIKNTVSQKRKANKHLHSKPSKILRSNIHAKSKD